MKKTKLAAYIYMGFVFGLMCGYAWAWKVFA